MVISMARRRRIIALSRGAITIKQYRAAEAKVAEEAKVAVPEPKPPEPEAVPKPEVVAKEAVSPLFEQPYAQIQRQALYTPAPPVRREVERIEKPTVAERISRAMPEWRERPTTVTGRLLETPMTQWLGEKIVKPVYIDIKAEPVKAGAIFAAGLALPFVPIARVAAKIPRIAKIAKVALPTAYVGLKGFEIAVAPPEERWPVVRRAVTTEILPAAAGVKAGIAIKGVTTEVVAPYAVARYRALKYAKVWKIPLEVGRPVKMKVKVKDPLEYLKRRDITILRPETRGDIKLIEKTVGFKLPERTYRAAGFIIKEKEMIDPAVFIRKGLEPKFLKSVTKHEAIHVKRVEKPKYLLPRPLEELYVRTRTRLPYTFEKYTIEKPAIPKYQWRKEFPIPKEVEEVYGIRGKFRPEEYAKEMQLQLWPKRYDPLKLAKIEPPRPRVPPEQLRFRKELRPLTPGEERLLRIKTAEPVVFEKITGVPAKEIQFRFRKEFVTEFKAPEVEYPFKPVPKWKRPFIGKKAELITIPRERIWEKYPITPLVKAPVKPAIEPMPPAPIEMIYPKVAVAAMFGVLFKERPKVKVIPELITAPKIEAISRAITMPKIEVIPKAKVVQEITPRQRQRLITVPITVPVTEVVPAPPPPIPPGLIVPKLPKPPKPPPVRPPPLLWPDIEFKPGKVLRYRPSPFKPLKAVYKPSLVGIEMGKYIEKAPRFTAAIGIRLPVRRKKKKERGFLLGI